MNRIKFCLLAVLFVAGFASKLTAGIAQTTDPGGKVAATAQPFESKDPGAGKPLPPSDALVRITTKPEAAQILVDGAPLDLRDAAARLAFGDHEIRAIGKADGWSRLIGARRFTVSTPQEQRIELDLDQRERFYRGKWLAEAEALRQEDADYRAARIGRPVALKLTASDQALKSLRAGGLTAAQLHAVMRIGDRFEIVASGRSWKIWKRHAELDPAFAEAFAALLKGRPTEELFKEDSGMHAVEAALSDASLAALAFALHAARTNLPHLDLGGAQLGRNGESIARAAADGALTVVARVAGRFGVQGLELKKIGDLYIGVAPPGNGAIRIEWDALPKRLLVVADQAMALGTDQVPAALRMGEKRIIALVRDRSVDSLVRISSGPEYQDVYRENILREGPLAAQIDLSKDEVGPNKAPGNYSRIWVVKFGGTQGATQRQINARYQVTDSEKDIEGDKFLRRRAPSGK
jgi:hypothetical protein